MRNSRLVIVIAFALGGCGGGNLPMSAPTPYAPSASDARPAPPIDSSLAQSGYPTRPSYRSSDSPLPQHYTEAQPAPRAPSERPGLGTEWGEARYSRTYETQFERASQSPLSVFSLNYNDRNGVDRFTGYRVDARQTANYSLRSGTLSVAIVHQDGTPYDAIQSGGRLVVIGRSGDAYTIVIRNHTPRRIEAVATVDGIDVISGKDGELSHRGYIIDSYSTASIDGFRKSEHEVAAFRFGAVGDSYAARTGRGRDVGVIGVAFFAERGSTWNDDYLRDTASPFPADSRFAQPPP